MGSDYIIYPTLDEKRERQISGKVEEYIEPPKKQPDKDDDDMDQWLK